MFSVNMFVPDCESALEFYRVVFGATVISRDFAMPQGRKNARFKIGDADFAMADENFEYGSKSPLSLGGVPICIQVELDDILEWDVTPTSCTPKLVSGVEKCVQKVLEMGGDIVAPSSPSKILVTAADGVQFCNVRDPFGYIWSLCRKQIESLVNSSLTSNA